LLIKTWEVIWIYWAEALKVHGIQLDPKTHELHVDGDSKEVLTNLVGRYEKLFGKLSREVCRDAVRPLLAFAEKDEIPEALR
jgi:hypothetical protein